MARPKARDPPLVLLERSLTSPTAAGPRPLSPAPPGGGGGGGGGGGARSIELPGVVRCGGGASIAAARGPFQLPPGPIDTHRGDTKTRMRRPVWYTLDSYDERWLRRRHSATLDAHSVEAVVTALELAAFAVPLPPPRVAPDPGTLSALGVTLPEAELAAVAQRWAERRAVERRPLLPELAEWPSEAAAPAGLLCDTPFLSREAELTVWRRRVDAPGLDVAPEAAMAYMQRAVAALEAVVDREVLRLRHTEAALLELALIRPATAGAPPSLEQLLAQPLSPLRAAAAVHRAPPPRE